MAMKTKCKCRKMTLPITGKVVIRCEKHRGRVTNSGRLVCYFDDAGIVQREQL